MKSESSVSQNAVAAENRGEEMVRLYHEAENRRWWISSDEMLPVERAEVLIAHDYHRERSVEIGFRCEEGWQLVRTDSHDMPILIPSDLVPYWRPIPSPPAKCGDALPAKDQVEKRD